MYKSLRELIFNNKRILKAPFPESYLSETQSIISLSTGLIKEKLILEENKPVDYNQVKSNNLLLERRFKKEPIAYLSESKEFYSKSFYVNRNTLVPRPETELIVDSLKFYFKGGDIVDLCCGTGCILTSYQAGTVTLINSFKYTDISKEALFVAAKNIKLNTRRNRLSVFASDLFKGIAFKVFSCITCNPPYISTYDYLDLMDDVKSFEPSIALIAGEDGLEIYRRIAKESKPYLADHGYIILEIGIGQKEDVVSIFKNYDYILCESKKDLAGIDRTLIFRKKVL